MYMHICIDEYLEDSRGTAHSFRNEQRFRGGVLSMSLVDVVNHSTPGLRRVKRKKKKGAITHDTKCCLEFVSLVAWRG